MKWILTTLTLLLCFAGSAQLQYHCYSIYDSSLVWKPADFAITVDEIKNTLQVNGATYSMKPQKNTRPINGYILTQELRAKRHTGLSIMYPGGRIVGYRIR